MTSLCAVVPVFDHELAVGVTTASLRAHGLTVLLVDDGSGPACAEELRRLAAADREVRLLRLPENRGKGAAVLAGLKAAAAAGFTHALQIDADGQHGAQPVGWRADRGAGNARVCRQRDLSAHAQFAAAGGAGRLRYSHPARSGE